MDEIEHDREQSNKGNLIKYSLMLILVAAAILFASLTLCLLKQQRQQQGLGILTVAVFAFSFYYLGQPLYLLLTGRLEGVLDDHQIAWGMIVSAAMIGAFSLGWRGWGVILEKDFALTRSNRGIAQRLWNFGLGSAVIGFVLFTVFVGRSGGVQQAFSGSHGESMAFDENTAYLYFSPWWILTGISMMLVAMGLSKLGGWRKFVTNSFIAVSYLYAVAMASRGWIFATSAVVFLGLSLTNRLEISLRKSLGFLLLAGLGVLLVFGYRSALHLGDQDSPILNPVEAIEGAVDEIGSVDAWTKTAGTEFVYHSTILATVDQTQRYGFGLNWLYLYTLHPIPRIWWPDKPYGFSDNAIVKTDIFYHTGLTIPGGAAPGIVADVYREFGLLSVAVFFLLGRFVHWIFRNARRDATPFWIVTYSLLYALSLNLFGQTLSAVLVPLPYAMAPIALWWIIENFTRHAPKRITYRGVLEDSATGTYVREIPASAN
jgi:hypothetical protein